MFFVPEVDFWHNKIFGHYFHFISELTNSFRCAEHKNNYAFYYIDNSVLSLLFDYTYLPQKDYFSIFYSEIKSNVIESNIITKLNTLYDYNLFRNADISFNETYTPDIYNIDQFGKDDTIISDFVFENGLNPNIYKNNIVQNVFKITYGEYDFLYLLHDFKKNYFNFISNNLKINLVNGINIEELPSDLSKLVCCFIRSEIRRDINELYNLVSNLVVNSNKILLMLYLTYLQHHCYMLLSLKVNFMGDSITPEFIHTNYYSDEFLVSEEIKNNNRISLDIQHLGYSHNVTYVFYNNYLLVPQRDYTIEYSIVREPHYSSIIFKPHILKTLEIGKKIKIYYSCIELDE